IDCEFILEYRHYEFFIISKDACKVTKISNRLHIKIIFSAKSQILMRHKQKRPHHKHDVGVELVVGDEVCFRCIRQQVR
ncbi:hypothetical protein AB4189_25625, partial [Vibrio sp. 10N.286.49.E1]|uniref:hypothetical protein n=1 Tax=Vibrio sp. 10N.286.49.E1 TaxID=3229702 RepID=UPI00354F95D5